MHLDENFWISSSGILCILLLSGTLVRRALSIAKGSNVHSEARLDGVVSTLFSQRKNLLFPTKLVDIRLVVLFLS